MNTETTRPICEDCSGQHAPCLCHRPCRRAALLINLGTPDSESVRDVRRYLREFLADPFVIKLPRRMKWFTPVLSAMIARFRGPQSAHAYSTIWWDEGSPLKVITERQCEKLKSRLGREWSVYYAMRYANPSIREVVARMVADGVTEVVVVPMYAQFAGPTTGTALEVLYRELRTQGLRLAVTVRGDWYDDRGYIESQAQIIHDYVAERGLTHRDAFLLFSTHSMPASYIAAGDPYEGQIRRTVELVRRRLGWPEDRMALSFQSKLGPVPWLAPGTDESLAGLAERGEKDVVVCPVSFTADCLETLEEIGMQYAELFSEKSGGGRLHLVPALNDDDRFIGALASLVRRGPQRTTPDETVVPLSTSSENEPLASLIGRLVMVGLSVPGRVERQDQPGAVRSDALRSLAKERRDVAEIVKACVAEKDVDGCVLVSTCQRNEVYALAERGADLDDVAARVKSRFPSTEGLGVEPAVLRGREAYRRMISNALGLSSVLPGDLDVGEQVQTAARMSDHAGALSPGLSRLLEEAGRLAESVRTETLWGEFSHDFASAAISAVGIEIAPESEVLLVGGSTTSRQLLKAMASEGDSARLTLAYRGAGRKDLVRFVRKVAPHANRLRVERYDEPRVLEAVASADVVVLGLDTREPTLRREHVEGLRDFTGRPLTIIDFNSHGSTDGLGGIEGVTLVPFATLNEAVKDFAARLSGCSGFARALVEARRYIEAAACAQSWNTERKDCVNGPCETCPNARSVGALESAFNGALEKEETPCQLSR